MNTKSNAYRNIILISQVSITIMVPIFLCLALGIWLGDIIGRWFTVLMIFLGIGAGARNAFILVMNVVKSEEARRIRQQEAQIARKVEKARQAKLEEKLRE